MGVDKYGSTTRQKKIEKRKVGVLERRLTSLNAPVNTAKKNSALSVLPELNDRTRHYRPLAERRDTPSQGPRLQSGGPQPSLLGKCPATIAKAGREADYVVRAIALHCIN
jgi:hypothetical protein